MLNIYNCRRHILVINRSNWRAIESKIKSSARSGDDKVQHATISRPGFWFAILMLRLTAIHEQHQQQATFPIIHLRNRAYTRATPPMPVRYLHGTPRTDLTHSAGVHTPTRVCATRRILSLFLASLPYTFSAHALGRRFRGTRKRAFRFAPLARYTGCYNERDVTSGISGADREEEARSVGW